MNMPTLSFPTSCAVLLTVCLLQGCATVEPAGKKSAALNPNAAASTYTVARVAAKPKPQLDAVFESMEMVPIKLEPKAWTELTVLEAVSHGTRVKKGDVLVKLDLEKLKEQVDDLEQDRPATVLGLELASADLENLEQTTNPRLEATRRAKRVADEDLAYYEKSGRAQKEKSAEYNIKNAEQRLEGAQEEMKQLEKMYKADDLTEDTEEIILKRQKFAVESAVYSLEVTKQSTDWTMKTSIPREQETLRAQKRDQEFALALAEQTLPRTLAKKRYDVEKLKRDQRKSDKRLADLKKDLESLSVRSPIDGVVYYGACEAGKWPTGAVVGKKLLPTGKLTPNEVFMTVVKPEKLMLRAVVQEAELAHFKVGWEGKASPVAAPDKKVAVKLEELGAFPLPAGGFEAKLSVSKVGSAWIVPGMNCKVSLEDSQKGEPLEAPKEAVFADGKKHFVYVVKSGNSPEKRVVKTGAAEGKMVQILEGLAEGEKILLSQPE